MYPFKLKSHPDRLLYEHITGAAGLALEQFDKARFQFSGFNTDDLCSVVQTTALFHDFGKASVYFQKYIGSTDKSYSTDQRVLQRHGLISALITFGILADRFPDNLILAAFGFIIVRRHHGDLEAYRNLLTVSDDDLLLCRKQAVNIDYIEYAEIVRVNGYADYLNDKFLSDFLDKFQNGKYRKFRTVRRLNEGFGIEHYFVLDLLYSLLLNADKTDAVFRGAVSNDAGILGSSHVLDYKSGFRRDPSNPIIRIRNDIFQSVNESVDEVSEQKRIFSINTPTGSGKTITALSAALKIREKFNHSRIIYCLPFTSVIDQNFGVFDDIRKAAGLPESSGTMMKHHHLTDICYHSPLNGDDERYTANEALFMIEGWESRMVVTTFVQFLYSLISYRNRSLRKFHKFSNAVIILDEVQAIPHKYWLLVREMLRHLTECLDSRIILVTATMPMIFSEQKAEIHELAKGKADHFQNLSRIELDVSRLSGEDMDWDAFCGFIDHLLQENQQKDILVVLNTIRSARELYRHLEGCAMNHRLEYLSSHIIPDHRLERIKQIKYRKKGKPVVVISTQLVEAGVDIDLDIVVRDFAPLDCIFQTSGRCNRENRHGEKGKVLLVSITDSNGWKPAKIYDMFLREKTGKVLSGKQIIPESDFLQLAQDYYQEVADLGAQGVSRQILECITKLEFIKPDGKPFTDDFQLIHDDYSASVYVEVDDTAENLWQIYEELKMAERDFEGLAELQQVKRKMAEYIINVPKKCFLVPPDSGLYRLKRDIVENHYSEVTGFETDSILPEENATVIF